MVCVRAVHDVDHLGVNNAFLVSTNHDIAIQHNDQCVHLLFVALDPHSRACVCACVVCVF